MEIIFSSQAFILALLIGGASGAIGSFIILKRMALVGDALSHVALPGIALALAYRIEPFYGVLAFLIAAAILVWVLEGRTKLPSDAIVGLLFTASLAVGILAIPDTEILESLFGVFPAFSPLVFWAVVVTTIVLGAATFFFAKRFLFSVVSPELARVEGGGRRFDFLLLLLFSCVVALGIKLVGTLLMGALTIIPASIAKNVSRSMHGYMIFGAISGAAISFIGVWIARSWQILPGPVIILLGVGCFLLTMLFKRI